MSNKLYFVTERDEHTGFAFIANSVSEAKKMAMKEYEGDVEWIDLRVTIKKNNIEGLPHGVVDMREGLKRDIYGSITDDCDMCGEFTELYQVLLDSGKCICMNCEEKLEEEKEVAA